MLGVEQYDAELLDRAAAELWEEELRGIFREDDLRPFLQSADERAAPGFDRGNQLRGACRANARYSAQFIDRRPRKAVQAAYRDQNSVGEFERARPGGAMAEHDREQFVVAKTRRAKPLELLARAIALRNRLHLFLRSRGPSGSPLRPLLAAARGALRERRRGCCYTSTDASPSGVRTPAAPGSRLLRASPEGNQPGPGCDRRGGSRGCRQVRAG